VIPAPTNHGSVTGVIDEKVGIVLGMKVLVSGE